MILSFDDHTFFLIAGMLQKLMVRCRRNIHVQTKPKLHVHVNVITRYTKNIYLYIIQSKEYFHILKISVSINNSFTLNFLCESSLDELRKKKIIRLYILYSLKQKYGKMAVHIYQNRLVATLMNMLHAIVEMHIDFYFPS